MKIVMTPNPYRDKQFRVAEQAKNILEQEGVTVRMCLPFEVDRNYELPQHLHFSDLRKELRDAQMLICFGGDGTILHASKFATAHRIPVLGVNIGTMGFIAELESGELELLRKIPKGDYTLEPRSMLDVRVTNGTQTLYRETALNDVVITKGAIARVIQIGVSRDGFLRRRHHRLHGDRLDGIFHVRRRPYYGAVGKKHVDHAHLRARDAGKEHRGRAEACHNHPHRQDRQAQRLFVGRRRACLPAESGRHHHRHLL